MTQVITPVESHVFASLELLLSAGEEKKEIENRERRKRLQIGMTSDLLACA